MGKPWDSLLTRLYYSPKSPGGLGGVQKLWKESLKHNPKIKMIDVQNWLSEQDTYTMFRQAKRKFPRLRILVDSKDEQWQADLMDMTWFMDGNDNVRYLLVAVDLFSRYAWVRCLKNKDGKSVSSAFEDILSEGRKPEKLQTDQGKEFLNNHFQSLLKRFEIHHFTSTDDQIKCAVVERLNRTLRARIYRYVFANDTHRYIDALQDIVEGYNRSFHRAIKMAPSDVNDDVVPEETKEERKKLPKSLKVGDYVRIQRKKGHWEKGATSNWTREIFKIAKVKRTPTTFIYHIEDLLGEPITSVHYPAEVMQVSEPKLYKVEKVLKTRYDRKTKKKQLFVKWLGYSDKFNSWING